MNKKNELSFSFYKSVTFSNNILLLYLGNIQYNKFKDAFR